MIYALGYSRQGAWNVEGKGRFLGKGFYIAATSQVALLMLVGKMGWDMLET